MGYINISCMGQVWVYVDNLAVHHSLVCANFGSSQNSLKLSQNKSTWESPIE